MAIIPLEKIDRPRILMLDFSKKITDTIQKAGYSVIAGSSGQVENYDKKLNIPIHSSEIELLFWNVADIRQNYGSYESRAPLSSHFETIYKKGGIGVIFLGTANTPGTRIKYNTGVEFTFRNRVTEHIIPPSEDDTFVKFLNKYVNDDNIKFAIDFSGNFVGYHSFYKDEAGNSFVAFKENYLIVLPAVDNVSDAILELLQDILPHITDESVFPDKSNFKWLEDTKYIPPPIEKQLQKINNLNAKFIAELDIQNTALQQLQDDFKYLKLLLVADDSDIFSDTDKLTVQVKKVLIDLGFQVRDIDEENLTTNTALKEDLQLEDVADASYIALVEVKGTEKGAKANWVRKDLMAHMQEYMTLNKTELVDRDLCAVLVFNHERRTEPEERTEPFKDDPNLVKYCTQMNITLIPVFELYKLAIDVITKKTSLVEARKLIKNPGLFTYTSKS